MKTDWTPLVHAALAALVQLMVWLVSGNPWAGGALACCMWLAREITQAEARYPAKVGGSWHQWLRGFHPKAWDKGSVLDVLVPVLACAALGFTLRAANMI